MQVYISFPGLYQSWLSPDSCVESRREWMRDYLEREYGMNEDETVEYLTACDDAFSFSDYREKVGARYTEEYESMLNGLPGLESVKLEFISIDSPREYNFVSDSCRVEISAADLRKVRKYAETIARNEDGDRYELEPGEQSDAGYYTFPEYVSERMRPRDGFIPFYCRDVWQWGAVSQWDISQTELLFDFVLNSGEVMDCGGCVNERLIEACEEYASESDPAPDEWLKEYRAEKAAEKDEENKERRAEKLYVFYAHRELDITTAGAYEDEHPGEEFSESTEIPGAVWFTGPRAAVTHARYLSQCGYITAADADTMAARINRAAK